MRPGDRVEHRATTFAGTVVECSTVRLYAAPGTESFQGVDVLGDDGELRTFAAESLQRIE